MKMVGILALENISNIGEELLSCTTEFCCGESRINAKKIQLVPSFTQLCKEHLVLYAVFAKMLSLLYKIFPEFKGKFWLKELEYRIRLTSYYKKEFSNLNGIIYAVGMFKYSTQNFSYIFEVVNRIATEYNIPVLMSAMSIEKENPDDWRYHQLVRAVNMPCVKKITTRDGQNGVNRLKKSYIKNTAVKCDFVGDPALWIPECYDTSSRKESDVIGIGVIRENIYRDYGIDFSGEQLLDMYVSLIQELDKRNQKWVLFCNGMPEDYDFGKRILEKLNVSDEKLLLPPKTAQELVDIILGFKVVFGARLHACITSFALDVPVVGLLWDNKLREFSKTMKIEEFFCEVEELKGTIIADKLEKAAKNHYDKENRAFYKQKTAQSIAEFIEEVKTNA